VRANTNLLHRYSLICDNVQQQKKRQNEAKKQSVHKSINQTHKDAKAILI